MILVADVTMSLDNVLAVAGAARGHFGLLLFGLALSIPLVVFASNMISKLMARYKNRRVPRGCDPRQGWRPDDADRRGCCFELLPWWGDITSAETPWKRTNI
jgi:hypothetical protein